MQEKEGIVKSHFLEKKKIKEFRVEIMRSIETKRTWSFQDISFLDQMTRMKRVLFNFFGQILKQKYSRPVALDLFGRINKILFFSYN